MTTLKSGECGLHDGSKAGDWRLPTNEEWGKIINPSWADAYDPQLVGTTACQARIGMLEGTSLPDDEFAALDACPYPYAQKIVGNTGCYSSAPWARGVKSAFYWSATHDEQGNSNWAAELGKGTLVGGLGAGLNRMYVWPARAGRD